MINVKNKGFTLIELMVVVVVLTILSGVVLSVINTGGVRSKARDSQRVADLKKYQTALELFFADNRSYPSNAAWQIANNASGALNALRTGNYISILPVDPMASGAAVGPCALSGTSYQYVYRSSGSNYVLGTRMEVTTSASTSLCNVLPNCTTYSCVAGCDATKYCVQNP